jgi:hypothetical protein
MRTSLKAAGIQIARMSRTPNRYPPISDKLPGGHGQPSLTVWLVLGNTRD